MPADCPTQPHGDRPWRADAQLRQAIWHLGGLLAAVALALAALWTRLPLDDPPSYFDFADKRTWSAIPNAANVLTNLPFVAVAASCWVQLRRGAPAWRRASQWLCGGLACTAVGSAWFHWAPSPATLFWDRLPMAMTFSGLGLLLVADRLSERLAWQLRWLLPLAAMATVAVWRWGGTLRPYLALQFGLMAVTLLVTLTTRSRRLGQGTLATMLALYSLAKVLEATDAAVWHGSGTAVAGHGLKHLLAAAALAVLRPRKTDAMADTVAS